MIRTGEYLDVGVFGRKKGNLYGTSKGGVRNVDVNEDVWTDENE